MIKMKKYKFGLVGIFLCGLLLISPSSVVADIFYRVPSYGLSAHTWTSLHFYYSEGDMVIIEWYVPTGSSDTIDVMVLDQDNYSLFVDELTFEKYYENNNTQYGYVIYEDISEDLYFLVFRNDQGSGMTFGYQFTLIEADTTCECSYNPDTPFYLATISVVSLAIGAGIVLSIWLIKKKLRMIEY